MRIVFLDRSTIGPGVNVRRPGFDHEWVEHSHTSAGEIAERLRGASVVITNKVPVGRAEFAALPDLRLVAVAATGVDVIDLAAAREYGVSVCNVRAYAAASVAEHAFAMILGLRRNLSLYRERLAEGAWEKSGQFCFFPAPIHALRGSVLGLVGCGASGRAMAAIGRAFGMHVAFLDSHLPAPPEGCSRVDLGTLLRDSDVISCHCPLTAETRGLFDRGAFERMKASAILINTARGGLVVEADLIDAIERGLIGGAGIDVLNAEPALSDSPMLRLATRHNVILTPHVAWASITAMQTLADELVRNIESFAAGTPRNLV